VEREASAPAVQVPTSAPAPEPAATRPAPPRRLGRAAPARPERAPVRWNIWSLERLAREHPESEELPFLVLSLREFADSAGQLPADFDALVRESFGDLLAG
jgi:hypothetical protein